MSTPPTAAERPIERDPRVDFFRRLALAFIFVDHVPDNVFARFTLRNFGFSDAAEVFIFLAGFSAVFAYGHYFDRGDVAAGLRRVGRRIGVIYAWHVALIVASVVMLGIAAKVFANESYIANIGLAGYFETPGKALVDAALLFNQPNMLNILPIYVVLLAWFPVAYMMMRRSVAGVLAVSVTIWLAANLIGINLPSEQGPRGAWFFNPFAWQLLLTIGALAAVKVRDGAAPSMPLTVLAAAYATLAFVMAAPWTMMPGLEAAVLIPWDALGSMDKSNLSLWRVGHVLSLAYLVWAFISTRESWLSHPLAESISRGGRHSLEVFSIGILLAFAGWIAINESQSTFSTHLLVTVVGLLVMGVSAWHLARQKAVVGGSARAFAPASPLEPARSVSRSA